jgi:hypothetical protein
VLVKNGARDRRREVSAQADIPVERVVRDDPPRGLPEPGRPFNAHGVEIRQPRASPENRARCRQRKRQGAGDQGLMITLPARPAYAADHAGPRDHPPARHRPSRGRWTGSAPMARRRSP